MSRLFAPFRSRRSRDGDDWLRRSEASLAEAQRLGRMGSWELDLGDMADLNRNELRWSDECFRVFGYEPGSVKPSNEIFFALVPPEDQRLIVAAVARALRDRTEYSIEHRIRRPDGTDAVVHERAKAVYDASGRPVMMLGTVQDVTERRRAEEELKAAYDALAAQRRLYQAILSSTPDLAYVFDLRHRFIYANDALLAMWGRTWSEAIGKTCLELGYPDWHAEMHDREIEQVIATKTSIRGEVPFTGTHGRRIYDYIFTPIFGEDGEVEGIAGTTRDVTELRRHATDLEDRVKARTEELRRSVEELERFTYTVAHDLRAPLRAVRRSAEMLTREGLPPETVSRLLESVRTGTQRMDRLIADLLEYSRVSQSTIRLQPVEVGRLVRATVESLSIEVHAHDGTVAVDAGPTWALGERLLIEQALTNLLTNALKFMPPGRRPVIEVGVRERDGRVRVWVQDNGIGIEAEHRDRVFRIFERLHARDSYPGTGIGLAIVSRAVERLNGAVGFDSEPGKGSRFWFELAATDAPA